MSTDNPELPIRLLLIVTCRLLHRRARRAGADVVRGSHTDVVHLAAYQTADYARRLVGRTCVATAIFAQGHCDVILGTGARLPRQF